MNLVFALLLAFLSPMIILPVTTLTDNTFILEEILKAVAVGIIILQVRHERKDKWLAALLVGVLFTLSETALYLSNFITTGFVHLLPLRLLLTGSIHSGTSFIMYAFGRKSWTLFVVGLIISIIIHYYYNYAIISF